jgi:hypothetical protein
VCVRREEEWWWWWWGSPDLYMRYEMCLRGSDGRNLDKAAAMVELRRKEGGVVD